MKVTKRAACMLATGVLATSGWGLLTASPASASTAEVDYWSAEHQLRGTAYFNANPSGSYPGDAIRACDWLGDGYGIEAQLDIGVATVPGTFHADRTVSTWGHAAGSSGYCTAWKTGNIAEGTYVALRVCKVTESTASCGRPLQLVA
jgi:hypothetical protein